MTLPYNYFSLLPVENSTLYSVEIDEEFTDITRQLVKRAQLKQSVEYITADVDVSIVDLKVLFLKIILGFIEFLTGFLPNTTKLFYSPFFVDNFANIEKPIKMEF